MARALQMCGIAEPVRKEANTFYIEFPFLDAKTARRRSRSTAEAHARTPRGGIPVVKYLAEVCVCFMEPALEVWSVPFLLLSIGAGDPRFSV